MADSLIPRKAFQPVPAEAPKPVPPKPLPSMEEFCLTLPLYAEFEVGHGTRERSLYDIFTAYHNIDFFCVRCEQMSTFMSSGTQLDDVSQYSQFDLKDRVVTRDFFCSRGGHKAYFQFRLENSLVSKIGQSPSMADISASELLPYSKVLTPEDYRELKKAVGLAAHGVGIGSFVYLRRIFERLIGEARSLALSDADWDEDLFQRSRMDDKIALLHAHLPSFLVEEKKMYGILSKGIHSLSEKECLEAFPILRTGIELILDEKMLAKQRRDKVESAKKNLGDLRQKLANSEAAEGAGESV